MIEATCSACGTLNRVSEANVPAGAKFFPCVDCKSRIAVPPPPPVSPASVPPGLAKPPRPVSSAKTSDVIDLADLPAPKRASALGPVPPPVPKPPLPAKPPVRSGLAAALDPELPTPKATRPSGPSPAPSLELDDLLVATPGASGAPAASLDDSADLPAPKRGAAPRPHDLVREEARADVTDLPAPKAIRDVADLPAPKRSARPEIVDLLAPKDVSKTSISDLPAPKRGPLIPDLPTPRAPDAASRSSGPDQPASDGFFDDLPQPALHEGDDLPQPALHEGDDLPQPALHKADDLPQPALPHDADLPAPKGFFDDLPQPALHKGADLPAPKGFFDDLPQPALHKGADLPAPKGFFDDLPQVKSHPSGSAPEVPAPKGFFDDIPGLPHTAKPEVPAPRGFFNDIPGPPPTANTDELSPRGFFDDLQQPAPAPPPHRPPPGPGPAAQPDARGTFGTTPLVRGDDQADGPELELGAPPTGGEFDDLDLSRPTAPPIRFERPRGALTSPAEPAGRDGGLSLELEGAPPGPPIARPAPRPVKVKPLDEATAARGRAPGKRTALIALLGVVVLGGGGFMMYRRHVAAVEREASIAEQLSLARASYAATDPQHWQRAGAAARRVLVLDEHNPDALGIAAESLLVSALIDGTAAATKIGQARAALDAANSARISTPAITRARALAALAASQPDDALAQLQPLIDSAPGDLTLALYLGWALAARGQAAAAIGSYDRATGDPAVKIAALYGRGTAKLALADLEGARSDFAAILEVDANHIGAQVGLAAALPPAAAQQQEAELLAILARKDIAAADPRAVVQAWTLAAHAALRAGRGDVARERFRKGLAINPQDASATTGLAETDLRDGNVAAAAELIATVLATSKDHVPAQLVQSEIEIKQNKLPMATRRLGALASHALTRLEQARLHMTTGKLLEVQGKDDAAVEAYAAGARAARDLDLAPLMAAVGKLSTMTAAAVQAKDTARADQLRARADQLLGELAAQAEHEPRLALILGMAYLHEGDAYKAESWLRRAADARPSDAEARFQLGRALLRSGDSEGALEALRAAFGLDSARADIGAELARSYEALGRDHDAGTLYARLLASGDPSLELRAHAGRFFARTGAIDRAREQGQKILEVDARNAAGLYLKGEGLLADGKLLEAKQSFQRALEIDRDPQYLDALGRAAEALAQGGDRELQDLALRSYIAAADAAPTMFRPLLGQGRLYVARHEAAKAVTPLLAAARIAPRNPEVMFLIGAAYQELEQSSTALQWLEQSMKTAPTAEAAWRIAQLHRDANQGQRAAAALASATRLAAEAESRTRELIPWLTDALYLQGRVNFDLHNRAAAREAWMQYVARNPPPSAQLTEVKQLLATSLRR